MPLNQGDGEAYLQDLDLRSVKYAELYRGADALRYGSLTLGGAINLITMTGRDAPPLETWLTGGSFGLLEAGMLSGWSNGPFDVFLNASSHFLDGFRDHSQENSQKVFSSLGYRISEWAENRLYLFWGRLSQNNPSSLTQEVMLAKSFSILTGFQAVYVQRNYVDGNQSNNEDFRGFSPKLGFLYQWNNQCKAYLNVSGSFQPPSFDQSLETAPDGNQLFNRLDAQTALTVELGTAGKAGPFSWDLAVYRSWVRNELLDLTNGQGVPLGTVNAPRTSHQGIEAGLQTELGHAMLAHGAGKQDEDRLVLGQTYTLSDFHFRNDPVYPGNRIAGTPVHFYKAELRYEHPCGFYFGPNIEWNVVRYPVDEANTLFAGPYALLGFRVGYKSSRGFEVFFEIKNLTDRIYAATVEPVGNAQIEGGRSFNPGNGRSFYAGISCTW